MKFYIILIHFVSILFLSIRLISSNDVKQKKNSGNGEFAITSLNNLPPEILIKIFEYLKVDDLCPAAHVCTNWYELVAHELNNRPTLELFNNTYPSVERMEDWKMNNTVLDISNQLHSIKPSLALFFSTSDNYNSVMRIVPHFKNRVFRNHSHSLAYFKINRIMLYGETFASENRNTMALIFFERPGVEIRDYYATSRYRHWLVDASIDDTFIQNIQPEETNHTRRKPYGLLYIDTGRFHSMHTNIRMKIVDAFQRQLGNFALWGFGNTLIQTHIDELDNTLRWIAYSLFTMGASISGPNVECYSLVIKRNDTEAKVLEKMQQFRKGRNIRPLNTIALSIELKSDGVDTWKSQTDYFVKAFPRVKLGKIEMKMDNSKIYCIDSMIEDGSRSPQIEWDENYLCYMFITYTNNNFA